MASAILVAALAAAAPAPEMDLRIKPISITLTSTPETETCPAASAPLAVRDASDARWFATGPTASHDLTELHAAVIAPLVNLALVGTSALRLYVFGAPAGASLRFSTLGWQPKWPFC